ncbi:MAG: hypothetical protein DRJ03_27665, partial [Chloroflexi bacterium]
MPITEKQRAMRSGAIGATDVAKILGVHPYATRYDAWLDKCGRLPSVEPNASMALGSLLEPALLDWAQREIGPLRRNQTRAQRALHLRANLDA